ncbi:hypothetical protein ACO22_00926 [Paracoccidioides brasiliensis]|uniref:Aminoglycoside phosphotransferase domain-containing protein n=1 Tax=Paracoccidioides brasiliensis TaxID=121759 RepID=A0A1D2JN02_PARBR|nr:hypothetical protein ACO22_00926 [Paracoccidioides brasiliensis]
MAPWDLSHQLRILEYFTVPDLGICPEIVKVFYLYRADIGSGNIMVSKDRSILGILDWEPAGFYPRFWIAIKPSVAPGLDICPPIAGIEEFEWRRRIIPPPKSPILTKIMVQQKGLVEHSPSNRKHNICRL